MKIELTVKELFARLESGLNLGRDNAGEVVEIPFTHHGEDGVASYEWDGLHFHGVDTNSTLMHYGNEPIFWDLSNIL